MNLWRAARLVPQKSSAAGPLNSHYLFQRTTVMPKNSSPPPTSQQYIAWAVECSKRAATNLSVAATILWKKGIRKNRYQIVTAAELHLNTASHRLQGTKLDRRPVGFRSPDGATWQFHLLRAQYFTQLAEMHARNALKNKSLKPAIRMRLRGLIGAIRLANLNHSVRSWTNPEHRDLYRQFVARHISQIQTLALEAHRNRTLRDWQTYARDLMMAAF